MYKYELIFNFKNNEQMLFIDGVEAVYKNGQASASGNGVTVKEHRLAEYISLWGITRLNQNRFILITL